MPSYRSTTVSFRWLAIAPALAALLVGATACGGSSGPKSVKGSATGTAPTGAIPVGYSVWPEAECDATHTSNSAFHGPQSGAVKWKAQVGTTTSGPSIGADGTIYDANDAGSLYAINPANGHTEWTFNGGGAVEGDLSTTPAVLPGGTIVYPGGGGKLFGLSPAGRQLWSLDLGSQPLSPVIAGPDEIYVMSMGGTLSAIQVSSHGAAARWSLALGKSSFGSPVIRSDGVIETTVDNMLVAIRDNGDSASELWRYATTHQIEVSPAIGPNDITVLGSNDGVEYGVDSSGKQIWKQAVGGYSYSSAAVAKNGNAYIGDNHGTLTVVNAATGKLQTTFHGGTGSIWTAPLVDSAGDVYYGGTDGHIYGYSASGSQLLDVATGKSVSSYPAMTSTGDLLIGSTDGSLYSIGR